MTGWATRQLLGLKRALRRVSRVQPINWMLTGALKGAADVFGWRIPEWLTGRLQRVGVVQITEPGHPHLRLWTAGDDFVPNQLYWLGIRNVESDALLFAELAKRSGLVVDVGAHIGLYSLIAASANSSARVLAFEAFPPNFARLVHNCGLNGFPNISAFPLAVAGKDGIATFSYLRGEGLPSSCGLSDRLLRGQGEILTLPVPSTRLDSFLERFDATDVDLVKVDTEGTEPEVLMSLGGILSARRPEILVEVLPETGTGSELEAIVEPLGYRYFHLTSQGPIERRSLVATGESTDRNWLLAARDIEAVRSTLTHVYDKATLPDPASGPDSFMEKPTTR